jgi:hypothetical protein
MVRGAPPAKQRHRQDHACSEAAAFDACEGWHGTTHARLFDDLANATTMHYCSFSRITSNQINLMIFEIKKTR